MFTDTRLHGTQCKNTAYANKMVVLRITTS